MLWSLVYHIIFRFVGFASVVTAANWLLVFVGAAVMFLLKSDHNLSKTFTGFIRYCFPPEMFKTRSCRSDVVLWIINFLFAPFLITPFLVGSVVFSAMVTIGVDFATYYTHYLFHKVPAFWEFHKVHHSAEFLTPISNKRIHPIEFVFDAEGVALIGGAVMGVACYVFSMPIYENTILGVDIYFLLNTLSFFNLRHSHISMSYGRLEGWLLSPAQHQLHHSAETRHWDKNIGLFLSVWDRLFGTFAYSEPRGSYRLGLAESEMAEYSTTWQLYTTPFVNVAKMAARGWSRKNVAVEPQGERPLAGHTGPNLIEDGSGALRPSGICDPLAPASIVAGAPAGT